MTENNIGCDSQESNNVYVDCKFKTIFIVTTDREKAILEY